MNNLRTPAGRTLRAHRHGQRGVATLVVVMVLFFIISLVAAYTSRNLIFEQRTSANQYRSTQALEAADAGIEWALAMLNHQRIDATCGNGSATDTSFRQRYLQTNASTGKLEPRPNPSGGALLPSCVMNGSAWSCSCPSEGAPSLTAPANTVAPAFRVQFVEVTSSPPDANVIRIEAVGCTRLEASGGSSCLTFGSQGLANEGRAVVTALLALTGNVASPPVATVVARQAITLSAAATARNTAPTGSGITLQAGGTISTPAMALVGTPGTPGDRTVEQTDQALSALADALPFATAADRMFAAVFNMRPATFAQQPALVRLACSGACSASALRDAIALNPGRPIWVPGDLAVDGGDIGSASDPVLLVVEGNLSFAAASTVYGLVYVRQADWTTAGAGQVQGAVVAEGNIVGAGTTTFVHDAEMLNRLRRSTGSFVRVPGSWKDYKQP